MLGPFGSQIMRIFNVLTPTEIERYTETGYHQQMRGSVAVGEEYLSLENQGAKPHLEDLVQDNDEETENDEIEETGAKIIPLHPEQEELAPAEDPPARESKAPIENSTHRTSSQPKSELEAIGVMSAASIQQQRHDELKRQRSKKESSSVFILKNRKKLECSQNKLKEQMALKTYQTQGAVEIIKIEESDEVEDESKIGESTGILIDKEQY